MHPSFGRSHAALAGAGLVIGVAGAVLTWLAVVELRAVPAPGGAGIRTPDASYALGEAQADVTLAALLTAIGVLAVIVAVVTARPDEDDRRPGLSAARRGRPRGSGPLGSR